MLQVFIAFIPWIVFWSLSGPGLWTPAVLGASLTAAGLVTWRWFKRRDIKTMEIVSLGYFAAHAIVNVLNFISASLLNIIIVLKYSVYAGIFSTLHNVITGKDFDESNRRPLSRRAGTIRAGDAHDWA